MEIKVYADESVSGRARYKPALSELRDEICNGKIRAVVVSDINRLSRPLTLVMDFIGFLRDRKVDFIG